MTSFSSRSQGAAAETLAANYLQAQGLTLIARNLRSRRGELDLVCLERNLLVIVEVRQRGRLDFGGALGSVTRQKQRRICRAAAFECQRRADWRSRRVRFDVIALQSQRGSSPVLVWIKDAFRLA